MTQGFFKTTYTIYTDYPTTDVELEDLARQATSGDAIAEGGSQEPISADDLPEGVASFFNLEDDRPLTAAEVVEQTGGTIL